MPSIIVKKAWFGYGYDFNKNWVKNTKEYPSFNKTEAVQKFFDQKFDAGEYVIFDPQKIGFGLGSIDATYTIKDVPCKLLLTVQRENQPEKTYVMLRGSKSGIAKSEQGLYEDVFNEIQSPLYFEPPKTASTAETSNSGDEQGILSTAIGWVEKIATFAGVQEDKVKTATQFVKDNPKITGALATTILPRIYDALTGKKVDLSLSGLGIDAAKGAAISAALSYFLGDKAPNLGGSSSSGSGSTSIFTTGANLLGIDTNDYIVYDGGSTRDEQTAQFQRCLIRLGGGNLEAERGNIQEPVYKSIIGVKVPGKKNYADDGRFGKWTLNASTSLFAKINKLNADQIKKDPSLEIKNPEKVPLAVITSTACIGKTDANSSPKEKEEASKMKTISESKVHKEFYFLSTKNEKLHTTLMEQLKKDLKRG